MNSKEINNIGARELSAAIIMQAVDDYDVLLYQYFTHAKDPVTGYLVKFEDFDYIASLSKAGYRSKRDEIDISTVESFFNTEWFLILSAAVGDYHADQIIKARRGNVGQKVLRDGAISKRMLFEIFKINDWDDEILWRR